MGRPVHIYKEKIIAIKGGIKMKKNTIENIIYAIFGSFLLGLGIDIASWTIGMTGGMLIIIAMCLAMKEILE